MFLENQTPGEHAHELGVDADFKHLCAPPEVH